MTDDRKPSLQGGERLLDDRGDVKNAGDPMDHVTRSEHDQVRDRDEANEGEGNKSADRRYRDGVARTVKSGQVEKKAQEAERALDSVYGDELREAEAQGRKHSRGEDPAVKKKR